MGVGEMCWQSCYWRKGITEPEALEREASYDGGMLQMSDILGALDPIEMIPEAEDLESKRQ